MEETLQVISLLLPQLPQLYSTYTFMELTKVKALPGTEYSTPGISQAADKNASLYRQ